MFVRTQNSKGFQRWLRLTPPFLLHGVRNLSQEYGESWLIERALWKYIYPAMIIPYLPTYIFGLISLSSHVVFFPSFQVESTRPIAGKGIL